MLIVCLKTRLRVRLLYRVEFLLLKEEVSPLLQDDFCLNSLFEKALIPVLAGGTDSLY